MSRILIPLALALSLAASACACSSPGGCSASAPVEAVIDCIDDQGAEVQALLVQLAVAAITSASGGGPVDWPALAIQAAQHGVAIGGCAFAQLVHGTDTSDPSTTLVASPAQLELERFRAAHGGVHWRTTSGVL